MGSMPGGFATVRLEGAGTGSATDILPGAGNKPNAAEANLATSQAKQGDEFSKPLQEKFEAWFEPKWADYKSGYITFHQLVWQSILMYCGQSWITWDKSRKVWSQTTPEDDYTPQPNINRFSPAMDAIASICKWPEVEAIPKRTSDIQAYEVSEIANMLADRFITDNGLRDEYQGQEDKIGEMGYNFILAGCMFVDVRAELTGHYDLPATIPQEAWGIHCTECDTFTKQPMATDAAAPQQCPTCGGPVGISRTTVQVPAGAPISHNIYKFTARPLSPIGILPRQGSHGMHDTGFWFYADRMNLDEIWQRWDYMAEPDAQFVDGYSQNYDVALNFWMTGYSSTTIATKEAALVIEVFIEPGKCKEIPEGLHAVRINERTILCEPWPFGNELPVVKADYLKIPRLFFPRSVAFDVAEIQKELNGYESIIKLHAMTSAVEPVVVDENTQVSQITGRSDKIVRWRSIGPGSKEPHRMAHGTLDEGVYKQRGELKSELENITGAVSVYRGNQPGSVTAASAISQLRGQAEMMFNRPVSNWMGGCKEIVRKAVKLMQGALQPWEIAAIVGPDKETQIAMFKAAPLDDVLDWVSTTHGLPRTRDEKRQEMMELFDRGALDINDANVREKIYELFGETGMMQQFSKDATRARMENQVMAKGGQPTFMPEIEDVATHFSVHAEFIKALDFDKLDEQAKEIILTHAMMTKEALMQAQMAQAAAQGEGGAGAGPDGKGGPKPAGGAGGASGAGPAGVGGPGQPQNSASKGKPGAAATNPRAPRGGPGTGPKAPRPASPGPAGESAVQTGPNGPGANLIPGGNR